MTIPEELRDVLDSNPEIISGAIRFNGTRVPLQSLLETLEDGGTVQGFLSDYPGVLREQANAVIACHESYQHAVLDQHCPKTAQ